MLHVSEYNIPSAADLQRRNADTQKRKEHTFQHILQICVKHIVKCSDLQQTSCMYEIPEFIFGLPIYDVGNVVQYLQHHLSARGFTTMYVFPRVLIIGWSSAEKKTPQQPPVAARVALPAAPPVSMALSRAPPTPMESTIGPPMPVNTSANKTMQVPPLSSKLQQPKTAVQSQRPFDGPQVRPIAELKPSGRFTLHLN